MFEDQDINEMRIWLWHDGNHQFLGCQWDDRPTLTAKTNSAGEKYFEYSAALDADKAQWEGNPGS